MKQIDELLSVMKILRDPDKGCPWDLQQDFSSIVPHTVEEVYEVADAIDRRDMDDLRDELGDLLFQIVFYAQLAVEKEYFGFGDVVEAITDKLLRRHPHVFAQSVIGTAEEQTAAWEAQKRQERKARAADKPVSLLVDIPRTLPALSRAARLQRRAARVGFDWSEIEPVFAKVEEELAEFRSEIDASGASTRVEEEMGDLLFACVNLARHAGIEPENALRRANRKFESRFQFIEQQVIRQGRDIEQVSLDEMESLWLKAKMQEKKMGAEAPKEPKEGVQ